MLQALSKTKNALLAALVLFTVSFVFLFSLSSPQASATQAACEASNGEWKITNRPEVSGTIVYGCVCPTGLTVQSDGSCGSTVNESTGSTEEPKFVKNDCTGENVTAGATEESGDHCGILDYLVLFINVLSALVGVVVVGSIIYGGIQYSTSGSDPQKVAAAKDRIRNAIIALIFFIFAYSFLNYLVPGGVL